MNLVSEYFGIQWRPDSCLPTIDTFAVSHQLNKSEEILVKAILSSKK